MIKPEVLDAAVAGGASAELIAAMVKADIGATKSHAQRQRRYRERHKASRDASQSHADANPLILPTATRVAGAGADNLTSLPIKKDKKVSKTHLDFMWQPSSRTATYSQSKGLTAHQYCECLEAMRFWAGSKGVEMADWNLCLMGFLRREAANPVYASRNPMTSAIDKFINGGSDYEQPTGGEKGSGQVVCLFPNGEGGDGQSH